MLTKFQANYLRHLVCNCKQTKEIKEIKEKLNNFICKNYCYFPDTAELEFFNSLILTKLKEYVGKDPYWYSVCMELHEIIINTLYRLNHCKIGE